MQQQRNKLGFWLFWKFIILNPVVPTTHASRPQPCYPAGHVKVHLGPDFMLAHGKTRTRCSGLIRGLSWLSFLHSAVLQSVRGEATVDLTAAFRSRGLSQFLRGLPALSQRLHEQGQGGEQVAESSQVERAVVRLSVVVQESCKTNAFVTADSWPIRYRPVKTIASTILCPCGIDVHACVALLLTTRGSYCESHRCVGVGQTLPQQRRSRYKVTAASWES